MINVNSGMTQFPLLRKPHILVFNYVHSFRYSVQIHGSGSEVHHSHTCFSYYQLGYLDFVMDHGTLGPQCPLENLQNSI